MEAESPRRRIFAILLQWMLELQRVLFVLGGFLVCRCNTGISWSLDRRQSKIQTSLRRSKQDVPRLGATNEFRFLLEYLVCRLLLEKKKQILRSSLRRPG